MISTPKKLAFEKKKNTKPILKIIYNNTHFNHKCLERIFACGFSCTYRQISMQQTGRGISLAY